MRKAENLLSPLAPVFHIPAPIHTQLKQVAQSWTVSPVSLWCRWQRVRPEWPEHPFNPAFVLTLGLILFGITASILGLAGVLTPLPPAPAEPPVLSSIAPPAPEAPVSDAIDNQPLEGLGSDAVRKQFGAPALIRHEPPAEIWQYRSTTCVLDLFLYPAATGRSVRHAEIRARQDEKTAPEFQPLCLKSLRTAAHN